MCIIDCRRPSFFVSRGKLLVSSSSVLGPSLHLSASASASTRDAPICHLPAAFAEHYGSITHRTVPGIPTVHALTVAARSTARRCTFAQTVRKDASIALLTTISPPQSINTLYSPVGASRHPDTALRALGTLDWTGRHGQFPATARRATTTQARPRCRCRRSRVGCWQSCPPFGRRAPGQPGPGLASRPSTQSARRASRHGAASHSWLPFTAPAAAAP